MTSPVPPAGDQPTYIDPVTGQPLYIDPTTGQLAYTDPTNAAAPTSPFAAPAPTSPYAAPAPGSPFAVPGAVMPGADVPGGVTPNPTLPAAPGADPAAGYPYPGYNPYAPVDPAQAGMAQPGYPAGAYAQNPYGYGGYQIAPTGRTNPMAITGMVLSLVGLPLLVCYGFGGLVGLAGAIVSQIARRQLRQRGEQGSGMALTGIIVGWIALALGVIIFTLILVFVVWAHNHSDDFTSDPTFN